MSTFRRITLGMGMLALVTAVGGCELGGGTGEGGDGDGDGDGDTPNRIPSDEPGEDDRLDALGIVCETSLIVTGTYEQTAPQPADRNGCWEVGIWTVNMVTVDFQGCDPQPAIDTAFTYEVTFDEEESETSVRFLDDPDNERLNLKITTSGDGLCHGSFAHYGTDEFPDNVVLTLQPTLQEDGRLAGIGAYSWYEDDPF